MKTFFFSIPDGEIGTFAACLEAWARRNRHPPRGISIVAKGGCLKVPARDLEEFCASAMEPLSPFTRKRLLAAAKTYRQARH